MDRELRLRARNRCHEQNRSHYHRNSPHRRLLIHVEARNYALERRVALRMPFVEGPDLGAAPAQSIPVLTAAVAFPSR
jgi:hypothetical protein